MKQIGNNHSSRETKKLQHKTSRTYSQEGMRSFFHVLQSEGHLQALTTKIITRFYLSHLQIIHLMVNENETFQEQRLDLSRRMPVQSFKLVTNNPDFEYSALG